MPRTTGSSAFESKTSRPLEIASRENRWLKRFRAALSGELRDAGGTVGVEGARLVLGALESSVAVEALLVSATGARHLARLGALLPSDAAVLRTTDKLFAWAADTETPQGVAALVRTKSWTLDDLLRGQPLIAILAGVQDPGNVGTILRAAEAFGASGAATCAAGTIGTANPLGPKALRASAGSALRLPLLRGVSAPILFAQLRVSGVKIYAAVPESSADKNISVPAAPWEADLRSPAALLIGNEGAGLPDELARSADARIAIPQCRDKATGGGVESLNAAMAGTVLLYEAMRQRTPRR